MELLIAALSLLLSATPKLLIPSKLCVTDSGDRIHVVSVNWSATEFPADVTPLVRRRTKAEKGNHFVVITFQVTTKDKEGFVPRVTAWTPRPLGELAFKANFDVRFPRWASEHSYMGLVEDKANDFRFTNTVRFVAGLELTDEELGSSAIVVAIERKPCLIVLESEPPAEPALYLSSKMCSDASSAQANVWAQSWMPIALRNASLIDSRFNELPPD